MLRLDHWVVLVDDDYAEDAEDVWAVIHPTEGRYRAKLRFGVGFWEEQPLSVRNTITHEMLHLHLHRAHEPIRVGSYRQELGQSLYNHFEAEIKLEFEYAVDALTMVLEVLVPLPPPWPA